MIKLLKSKRIGLYHEYPLIRFSFLKKLFCFLPSIKEVICWWTQEVDVESELDTKNTIKVVMKLCSGQNHNNELEM